MGAAASALPEKMTEDELKAICGDKFDQAVYDSLKDEEGFVDRDKFLAVSQLGQGNSSSDHVAEAKHVFTTYCHGDEMDSRTYIKLCKDLKFLNKKFTSGDADLVFQKAKTKNSSITFEIFKNEILADIAAKKGVDVSKLIGKIAASDGPVINATTADSVKFHDDKSTYTGAIAKNQNFKNDITAAGDEQHAAATKVQNVHRVKQAQRQVNEMKEIKNSTSKAELLVPIDAPKAEGEDEQKVKELFLKFCPNGEMDSRIFIKLCRDCSVISKTFTAGDADLVFQKAKAAASHPSAGSYSSGVVHGKRVSYDVFRAIAIPCIAEKKKIEVSALLAHLATQSGPVLNGVTTADAVRFHDDKSTYTGAHSTENA